MIYNMIYFSMSVAGQPIHLSGILEFLEAVSAKVLIIY